VAWECPKCNLIQNDESTIRCACGYETEIQEEINYDRMGGALYLVLAGLVVTSFINAFPFLERLGGGNGLSTAPIERMFLLFSLAFYVLLPIVMITLLIKRKKILRPIMISYYLMHLLISALFYYAVKSLSAVQNTQKALIAAKGGVFVAIITCGVWVSYFWKSERVKKTLTR
jgi:hypothetical protein